MARRRVGAARPRQPRFAVAWFPRFEGIERIEAFRKRHDPVAHLIPAHLSLVFPFPTSLTRLQVETHVKRVVARFPVIPLTFRTIKPAASEFAFLMAARGGAAVTELHDRLYTRALAPHLRRDLDYLPHITLARHATLEALDAAIDEARDTLEGEYRDVLREVTLLAVEPDGRIAPLAVLPLDSA
jgi:2'-5' RNA ligase